jgi:two-component system phosphate regulon response regulator PhoB
MRGCHVLFRKKKKILVIDDNPDIVEELYILFSQEGYDVRDANTGEAGYNKAVKETPDLIILDIMLPGRDGYQIARYLKENQKTVDIPILILSVKDTPSDIERALKLNVNGYVTKPFDIDRLREKVKQILK